MAEKIVAKVKREDDRLHLTCEAFGISEYCVDEAQAKSIIEAKAKKPVEIEWVKDYINDEK